MRVATYMAGARDATLPATAERDTKHRILDTIAAMVSGAQLLPGQKAIEFLREIGPVSPQAGGKPGCTVLTTEIVTAPDRAAMANGMFAHADETDDAEQTTSLHPGAAVVPAAIAIAERENRSGLETLKAVALGYDLSIRFVRAIGGFRDLRFAHRSTESYGGSIGAAAAAGSLLRLDAPQMAVALSYAVQQAGGIYSWPRDPQHVEKAFDFAGQAARNGIYAAFLPYLKASGVPDVLDNDHNALNGLALPGQERPEELTRDLGSRFAVSESTIKAWATGLPVMSSIDCLLKLMDRHQFGHTDVVRLTAAVPRHMAPVVNDRNMPDVNLQHILAVILIDGKMSFEASHDFERMRDPRVLDVKKRIQLIGDPDPNVGEDWRSGWVQVELRNGRTFEEYTRYPPGHPANPMGTEAVEEKARSLMEPVIGARRTAEVITRVRQLERLTSLRELMVFLGAAGARR